jgi:hypothetical protein
MREQLPRPRGIPSCLFLSPPGFRHRWELLDPCRVASTHQHRLRLLRVVIDACSTLVRFVPIVTLGMAGRCRTVGVMVAAPSIACLRGAGTAGGKRVSNFAPPRRGALLAISVVLGSDPRLRPGSRHHQQPGLSRPALAAHPATPGSATATVVLAAPRDRPPRPRTRTPYPCSAPQSPVALPVPPPPKHAPGAHLRVSLPRPHHRGGWTSPDLSVGPAVVPGKALRRCVAVSGDHPARSSGVGAAVVEVCGGDGLSG